MVSLIVVDIIEDDFGCEGRPDGYTPKCKVVLKDFSGNVMEERVADADLYAQNIGIGDQVHFEMEKIVKD